MKTLRDLKEMRNMSNIPFGNQYDSLFMTLENAYIKSHNGQIEQILEDWDTEAREFIIDELINILIDGGMILDQDEIDELTGLIDR